MVQQFNTTLLFLCIIIQLLKNSHVSMKDTVDKFIYPIKIMDMALIKDLRNLVTPARGVEIPNIAWSSPVSEISTSEVSSTSSSSHSAIILLGSYTHALADCTLISTAQLDQILRMHVLHDAIIRNL